MQVHRSAQPVGLQEGHQRCLSLEASTRQVPTSGLGRSLHLQHPQVLRGHLLRRREAGLWLV